LWVLVELFTQNNKNRNKRGYIILSKIYFLHSHFFFQKYAEHYIGPNRIYSFRFAVIFLVPWSHNGHSSCQNLITRTARNTWSLYGGIFVGNWWHFPYGCHSAIKTASIQNRFSHPGRMFSNRFGDIPLFSLWLSFTRRGVKVYFNLISLFAVICRHLMAGMNMNWIGCDGSEFWAAVLDSFGPQWHSFHCVSTIRLAPIFGIAWCPPRRSFPRTRLFN